MLSLTIGDLMIDCANAERARDFYADLTDWEKTVEEAIRLGAYKTAEQYGGDHFVTLLDPVGHPFCLCRREKA